MLIGPGAERLKEIEAVTKRVFLPEGKEGMPLDHFAVLDKGTVEKLAPQSQYKDGQELDVKLGELALHDSEAAMGKVDGYEVCVGDAARLVGKKVKVRVERVLDGTIYASLVVAPAKQVKAADPITAEGLAEKPTRATGRKGVEAVTAPVEAEGEAVEPEPVESDWRPRPSESEAESEVADAERAASAEAESELDATGQAPRKRTRRGSRGGRRRRKPAAAAVGSENGARGGDRRRRGRGCRRRRRPADPSPRPVARRRGVLRERRPAGAQAQPVALRAGAPPAGRRRKRPRKDRPPSRSRMRRAGQDAPAEGEPKRKKNAPRLARRPAAAQDARGRLRVGARIATLARRAGRCPHLHAREAA